MQQLLHTHHSSGPELGKNCEYWDPGSHNQCREHITEYITDRERANFCTNFTFKDGAHEVNEATDAKAKLENLFK